MKGKFGNLGISKGMPFDVLQRCMKTENFKFSGWNVYRGRYMCMYVCVEIHQAIHLRSVDTICII